GVDAVRQARLLWRSFPQTARSEARGSAANRFRIGGDMGTYSNLSWQLLVQFLLVLFLTVAVSGWVSPRRVTRTWDDMHMNLDALVEAHPRPPAGSSPALRRRR